MCWYLQITITIELTLNPLTTVCSPSSHLSIKHTPLKDFHGRPTVHRLDPLSCSKSELTSETMNPFVQFLRTPWMGIDPSQGLYLHSTAQHLKPMI